MIESVDQESMPPSFRVEPVNADADVIQAMGDQFAKKAGVREVVFALDTVKTMQRVTNIASFVIIVVACFLLVAAVLLILNTIRTAMFARRREIEVMKLVGATNWFIRLPFMLEGLLQGLAGAALGSVLLLLGNADWTTGVRKFPSTAGLGGFVVTDGDPIRVGIFMVLLGAFVGAVGSATAASRFLDV